ncbi:SDR family oxidoreductase [Spirochaetota bacterium]
MKNIVITGSTKGIGLGLAGEFLKKECSVAISARGKDALEKAVKSLGAEFGEDKVFGKTCDVSDINQVKELWDGAMKKFGKIDIWLNNAGMSNTNVFLWELDADEINNVVDTNLKGLMYGCKIAIEGMIKQGHGQIFNFEGLGSDDMMYGGLIVYGATKRAVRYFTEGLIIETSELPIQVCTISPGMVITDLLIKDLKNMPQDKRDEILPIFNTLADTVETVTPFLVEKVLETNESGSRIDWMTPEDAQERFNDEKFYSRNMFSDYGL